MADISFFFFAHPTTFPSPLVGLPSLNKIVKQKKEEKKEKLLHCTVQAFVIPSSPSSHTLLFRCVHMRDTIPFHMFILRCLRARGLGSSSFFFFFAIFFFFKSPLTSLRCYFILSSFAAPSPPSPGSWNVHEIIFFPPSSFFIFIFHFSKMIPVQ